MSIQNGKRPLSQKPKPSPVVRADDIFGNPLSVPSDVRDAAEKAGLVLRFIDYGRLSANGGYHERGWQPLKPEHLGRDKMELPYFNSPDGYLRRGSLVLAQRSKQLNEQHKAIIAQERHRYANIQKKHADQIQREAREAGVDVVISEGAGEE